MKKVETESLVAVYTHTNSLKNKGITLIALVITIVILLILAGVSISFIFGENGLITQAQEAKTKSSDSATIEKIQIEVAGSINKNGKLDNIKIIKNLKENLNVKEENIEEKEDYIKITLDNQEVVILSDGTVSNINQINFEKITNNAQKYYGKIVKNYNTGNEEIDNKINWQIFNSSENEIFLISSDYIIYDQIPESKDGTKINVENEEYKLFFTDIVKNYKSENEVSNEEIKKLNKQLYEQVNSNLPNMKVVNYLVNPEVWKKFCNEKYAEYAIGVPTFEMFIDSYNRKYKTNYITSSTTKGYQVSIDEGTTFVDYCVDRMIINKDDDLYCVNNGKTTGMWLASPSNRGNNFMMCIQNSGTITGAQYFDVKFGVRPVICISSNCKILELQNGELILE